MPPALIKRFVQEEEEERSSMTPNPSSSVLFEMVRQNHDTAENGHKRLRDDIEGMERRLTSMQLTLDTISSRILKIESTPMNVDKVIFSGKQLAAAVGACVVLAGGMWQLHVGIDSLQTEYQNATKLQDDRNEVQKEAMRLLTASLEMRRVEIQKLSDLVQGKIGEGTGARK